MAAVRSRWTRVQARAVVDELEASGQSVAAFARQRGLHAERVRRWRTVFRREAGAVGPRLVELVARKPAVPAQVRIVCPSGHQVEVTVADLEAVLRTTLLVVADVGRC